MTFDHPWLLLLALLPIAWAAWSWRGATRRGALALKAGALAAVLLALSEPALTTFERRVAVVMLADTSASIGPRDLNAESQLANQLERGRGRHWFRVMPFARATREPARDETSKGWHLRNTAAAGGHATNLEAAIGDGVAALPAGLVPRLLLVSDGNENVGSVARAVWQAQQLGVPVDTVALPGRPKPSLTLESVGVPAQVFSGEHFPIEVTLASPKMAAATVNLTVEGKSLGASKVELAQGENHLHLEASVNTAGAIDLAGKIEAPGLGETSFENAVTLRRPRVLLVSRDPADSETHLLRALAANQFDVQISPAGALDHIGDYQLIIINNWDMQAFPEANKSQIEDFVKQGGGLLWIAGERNVYVEKKGPEDPLERALPAKLAPPRSPEGTAVVLIIDKSSSMEGRKIELARRAASNVVGNLRPYDMVGILVFDNSFEWAIPIRKADDRPYLQRMIAGIVPDGGTQIAPALAEAYTRILPQNAMYKHIVLLTDGISEEGDAPDTARQAVANHITISTVGLGQDVNRAFLEKIADLAQGKSYFLNEPSGLEQLLLHDVEEHTGTTTVERDVRPMILQEAEILNGVGLEKAPALRGYVRFETRPTATAILGADREDPLLVRWQYGLGRSAVFTSDAKNRWAINWVNWPGYDHFWANVCRDLLPHAMESEATADFDRAANELVVDYHLSRNVEDPAVIPDIYALGPNGFQTPFKISKVAAGHYRGRLAIGQRQGLFRIRPLEDSRVFPEVGFYRQEDELLEYGNDEQLLRQVAQATGGHFHPSVRQVFDAGSRGVPSKLELWPELLILAILLNVVELILRKRNGVLQALRLAPRAETEPAYGD